MSAYRQGYLRPIPEAAGAKDPSLPSGFLYEPIYIGGEPVTTVAGDVLLGLIVLPA